MRPPRPGPTPSPVLPRGHRLLLGALLALLLAAPLRPLAPPAALAQEAGKRKEEGPKEGRKDGAKNDGAKQDATEKDTTKKDGTKQEPAKKDGTKKDGAKADAAAAKEPRKSEDEILLESLAASWKKGDHEALAARFPAKRRVSLRLPGFEAGDYRAAQAASVLAEYFGDRTFRKVERKSVRETAGTFAVEYVRTSDGRTVRTDLLLVVGTEGEARVLVGVRESP